MLETRSATFFSKPETIVHGCSGYSCSLLRLCDLGHAPKESEEEDASESDDDEDACQP